MSKQIMIAERPGDSVKQSIGNYKGVMLCNRPNDPSDKLQRDGPAPFISRVTVKEQLGLNPSNKPVQQLVRPKKTLEILSRHKQWLFQLQKQKEEETQKELEKSKAKEAKLQKMKKKFSVKKPADNNSEKSEKLTEKNLKILEKESKPKWALTQEQAENLEEQEVDDLLQFVQDLDYDRFIEDLEVRQALEIVKERVEEIKQDKEWKKKIAEKYNNEEKGAGYNEEKSVGSRGSIKSYESKARSQINNNDKGQDWDRSTRPDKVTVTDEERVAKLVADQVLANYPNLKSVHSNASVRKMLEREARNQLAGPVIATIRDEPAKPDPSNLPYLHRNPAV